MRTITTIQRMHWLILQNDESLIELCERAEKEVSEWAVKDPKEMNATDFIVRHELFTVLKRGEQYPHQATLAETLREISIIASLVLNIFEFPLEAN